MLGLALLGACGDDGDGHGRTLESTGDTSSTAGEETTTTTEAPTDLDAVVLQLDELPTGYTLDAQNEESDDSDEDDVCPENPDEQVPADETVEVGYTAGDLGPFASNIVGQYSDEATALEYMGAAREAFADCPEYTDPEDGTVYTFSSLSFPDLGDDTFAIRMSGNMPVGPVTSDLIYIRVDDRVSVVANLAFDTTVDSELTEEWSRAVADRM